MNCSPPNQVDANQALLERLANTLLPGVLPYFVPASRLPAERILDDAGAFTGRLLDVALMPELQRLGLWRGRAPAIVLNDAIVQAACAQPSSEHQAERERDLIVALAVHELAHTADIGVDLESRQVGRADADAIFAYSRLEALAGDAWPNHGPRWFRIAAHAIYRAESIGLTVSPMLVYQSQKSHPTMAATLMSCASELERLAAVPLDALRRITPPSEYVSLWRFKAAAWRRTRPRNDASADRALEALEHELQSPIAG